MSVDPKCFELAEYFLAEYPNVTQERTMELAEAIQQTIEDLLRLPEETQ